MRDLYRYHTIIIILSYTLNLPHPFLFQALHSPTVFATAAAASANATDNLDSKTKQVSKAKDYDPKTLFSTLKSKKGTDVTTYNYDNNTLSST